MNTTYLCSTESIAVETSVRDRGHSEFFARTEALLAADHSRPPERLFSARMFWFRQVVSLIVAN